MKETVEYFKNGKVQRVGQLDEEGNKQGRWFTYFENGNLFKEENYLNGRLNGKLRNWNQNGTIVFELDMSVGTTKVYDESGSIIEERVYKDGSFVIKNFWDENGHQTLVNGTGFTTERYGAMGFKIHKCHYNNYKFISEEKVSSPELLALLGTTSFNRPVEKKQG